MFSAPAPDAAPASHVRYYGDQHEVYEVALHEPLAVPQVPETLLHDLWAHQRFNRIGLTTTTGESIIVINPGTPNTDAGPDFLNAHLLIGTTAWHGDVELHHTSGQWFDHGHHLDARYNSVVLHIALQADIWTSGLLRQDDSMIPELVLAPILTTPLRQLLYDFRTRADKALPCANHWPTVEASVKTQLIETHAETRLQERVAHLEAEYLKTPDLEAILYATLFEGLGYAKNAAPMRELVRRIPLDRIRRLVDAEDRAALFFGTAGLIPGASDIDDDATAVYAAQLRDRFARLQSVYPEPPMPTPSWRFFRLRPNNFPTLRIAQGLAWLADGGLLMSAPLDHALAALESPEPLARLRMLLAAPVSDFWQHHVHLKRQAKPHAGHLGTSRADTLLLNAVLPVLLLHIDHLSRPDLRDRVVTVLQQLPPEDNEVIREFTNLGHKPKSAYATQGLYQLYRTQCQRSRCLACSVGQSMLKR
ncbi:MAG: DUF2851 family protein [Rhodothermales bacterium]